MMRRLLAVITALCLLPLAARAETPSALLQAMLDAYNGGRGDAFATAHGVAPRTHALAAQLWREAGTLDMAAVESQTPHMVQALLREAGTDDYARVRLDLTHDGALSSLSLGRLPEPPLPELAPKRLPLEQLAAATRDEAARLAARGRFAGVVLI
ncbi:MAG TPA: hypothetical protein VIT92_09015, partial [Burkholderiaceae bacterium]